MTSPATQTDSLHKSPERRTLYAIKPAFVAALNPLRDRLVAAGVNPDHVTLAAVPVEVAVAAALIGGTTYAAVWLLVPPLALVWMGLNALDGSLARTTNTSTAHGAVLNEFVDRGGDLLVLGAGFLIAPVAIAATALAAVAASEIAAAVGWAVTGERHFSGPMGKPDRAAILAVGATVAVLWTPALTLAYLAIALGAGAGVLIRSRHVLLAAHRADRETTP